MNKKTPIYRMCIVTREKLLKEDLFRVVKNKDGIYFDKNQNVPGRGVYIKKDLEVIKKAHAHHSLARGLRCAVSEEIYLALIQALGKERR